MKEADLEKLARELWTIGDLTRLRILNLLPESPACDDPINVSQMAEQLGLSQPTVSNHLARLRTLGIVRHRKMCRDVYYWIDPEISESILASLRTALKVKGESRVS